MRLELTPDNPQLPALPIRRYPPYTPLDLSVYHKCTINASEIYIISYRTNNTHQTLIKRNTGERFCNILTDSARCNGALDRGTGRVGHATPAPLLPVPARNLPARRRQGLRRRRAGSELQQFMMRSTQPMYVERFCVVSMVHLYIV